MARSNARGIFLARRLWQMELEGFEAVRGQVAGLLHAAPAEIAVPTRNVTDGINIVLHGLDWRPGDQVIVTDQEHPSGTAPLAVANVSAWSCAGWSSPTTPTRSLTAFSV